MNRLTGSSCAMILLFCLCVAATGLAAEATTDYGEPTVFNGQQVRVFFAHNDTDISALGVEVPAEMYLNAPMLPASDGKYDVPVDAGDPGKGVAWHCCGYEIVLALPESAVKMSAFRHVVLNWNPQGHVPPGIYNLPHTDFHFYFISNEERLSIGGARDATEMCKVPDASPDQPPLPNPQTCDQFQATAAELPPDQMPAGYVNMGATEPAMGNHLIDPASHEFHGQLFDHTFIYMTNKGRLTGMEPMISLDFLHNVQQPVRVPIAMPAAFPMAGLYPTEYVVENDRERGVFRVAYESWKTFPASAAPVSAGSD